MLAPAAMRGPAAVDPAEIAVALGERAPGSLQTLLSRARRACYGQRDILYHQGDASDSVFFITRGLLKLVIHLRNGRARIVRLHRPGAVLGLNGVHRKGNEHTAVGITPVAALRLPLKMVKQLRAEDPTSYLSLVERWDDYLEDADRWITQFSTGAIRGRVARLLAFLRDFVPNNGDRRFHLLTCEEMGSILGVTSESVSRVVAEFKRQKIITQSGTDANTTHVADPFRLHQIAEE